MSEQYQSDDALISSSEDLESAKQVLTIEAQAILDLRDGLDQLFVDAVKLLANIKGRVIISGMGKSGHIGRKIAATMASTGTPAQFVHPGEASHGDLGMITAEDAVICLSNSGGTQELTDIIAYTARFQIPLIGIVGKADSRLGRHANIALVLPNSPEACPMGLAPTTSTTLALAIGDALAVALLERKGFSSDQFHVFHPGGKLGQSLVKVQDLMHMNDEVPLISEQSKMSDAILEMTAKGFGCVGVVNDAGQLAGIITDGDIRRHMGPDLMQQQTGNVMTPEPQSIRPDALAAEALGKMNRKGFNGITCLFVTKDKVPVGILSVHDCLRNGVM
jgi:arabinose-5-phosphate isomerase